jgi:hypothetical protein
MRRIAALIMTALALSAPAAAQEGNPCQASLTTVQPDPNQLAFTIEDLDKSGATTIEFIVVVGSSNEPQVRTKIPRSALRPASFNGTNFPLCYVLDWTPPANLTKDGKTLYYVQARTEDAAQRVSAWSTRSNPFTLGTVVIPDPPPLPVPGVRVGRTGA